MPADTATVAPDRPLRADESTVEERFPLLPGQLEMLLLTTQEPTAGLNVLQISCEWDNSLDDAESRAAFVTAWQRAATRHPVLRTGFRLSGTAEPVQEVHDTARVPVTIRPMPTEGLDAVLVQDRALGFDISEPPLLRVTVLQRASGRPTVLVTLHHAILDGRSMRMLLHEVAAEHTTKRHGSSHVPTTHAPFGTAARWLVRHARDTTAVDHWRAALAGVTGPTPLPAGRADRHDEPRTADAMGTVTRDLDPARSSAVRALATAVGSTTSSVLQAAWALLLAEASGHDDVVVDVTRSVRHLVPAELSDALGPMVATVPLRVVVDRAAPVPGWLTGVRGALLDVRDQLVGGREAARAAVALAPGTALASSLVLFERETLQTALRRLDPHWAGRTAQVHRHHAYPLTLYAFDEPRLRLLVLHDRRTWGDVEADAIADRLVELLDQLVAAVPTSTAVPGTTVGSLLRGSSAPVPVPARGSAPVGVVVRTPPATTTERALAGIWAELLTPGTPIAAQDDFVALGGHSVLATRLALTVQERLGVRLPAGAVHRAPVLRDLAALVDDLATDDAPVRTGVPIVRRDRTAHRLSTPALAHRDTDHLVRPVDGPWALWRWSGLRATGFALEPLLALTDPALTGATDALLDAEDRRDAARRTAADAVRARLDTLDRDDDRAARTTLNKGLKRLRQGRAAELADTLDDPDGTLAGPLGVCAQAEDAHAAALAALAAEAGPAGLRRSAALRAAAANPRFREAVTWQNRSAVRTGLNSVLRAETGASGSQHRQHEALVASYLQRYCAKNDTIGFFGPVGWARLDGAGLGADESIRVRHHADPLARRTVFFEQWGITRLGEVLAQDPALRPWLRPRRMPFVDVEPAGVGVPGGWLHAPLSTPTPLGPGHASVLAACDGRRSALAVAALVMADPGAGLRSARDVFAVLADLRRDRRIEWALEPPSEDMHPERALREQLAEVSREDIRERALAPLDQLIDARDAVSAAAGDADRLADALAGLDEVFANVTGSAATRKGGETYAARTLVYEDCRRSDEVTLSPALLAPLMGPLGLLLDSARWFTFAGAALFRRACTEVFEQHAGAVGEVPFADFWMWANDLLFRLPDAVVARLVRSLQERWATVLRLADVDPGDRRVQRSTAELLGPAATAFRAPRPGWSAALQHSPDVLMCADDTDALHRGDVDWVVGEVHPGVNTLRAALFVQQHPDRSELDAAMAADLPPGRVVLAASSEGVPIRLTTALVSPGDLRLVFASDTAGIDPATALPVGACVLRRGAKGGSGGDRIVVASRDGAHELDLMEVLGELLMLQLMQHFKILPPAAHTPRITVDRVVISRETWRVPAADLTFAQVGDEIERFASARRWCRELGLPDHVYVKTPDETKPFFVDTRSLASIDLLARAIRRTVVKAEPGATISVSEMSPEPDRLWLADAEGGRHCAELRLVAVDTRGAGS